MHHSLFCRSHHQGMTLLEILGVLVILGMLSAVLMSAIPRAPEKNISQKVLQFDQRLRQAARTNGPLRCEVNGRRLEAQFAQHKHILELPIGARFTDLGGQVLRSWTYDRYGCSIDYSIVWPKGRAFVAGLSGTLHQDPPILADD